MTKTIQVVDTATGLWLGNIEHAKLGSWLAKNRLQVRHWEQERVLVEPVPTR